MNEPEMTPGQNADDALKAIRKDLESGGPLSAALGEYERKERAGTLLASLNVARLAPGAEKRGLSDYVEEETMLATALKLMQSIDPAAASEAEIAQHEKLATLYAYARDQLPGVETYEQFIGHLSSGKCAPSIIELWVAEGILSPDAKALRAVLDGNYNLTEETQAALQKEVARNTQDQDALGLMLEVIAETRQDGNKPGSHSLIEAFRRRILPLSTVTQSEMDAVVAVTREYDVQVRPLSAADAAQFRSVSIARVREVPAECSMSLEVFERDGVTEYENDLNSFRAHGGIFYGAFHEGKLVGLVRADPPAPVPGGLFSANGPMQVVVQNLYTLPEARSAGVEKQLVEAAIQSLSRKQEIAQVCALLGGPLMRFGRLFSDLGFTSEGAAPITLNSGTTMAEMFVLKLCSGES